MESCKGIIPIFPHCLSYFSGNPAPQSRLMKFVGAPSCPPLWRRKMSKLLRNVHFRGSGAVFLGPQKRVGDHGHFLMKPAMVADPTKRSGVYDPETGYFLIWERGIAGLCLHHEIKRTLHCVPLPENLLPFLPSIACPVAHPCEVFKIVINTLNYSL